MILPKQHYANIYELDESIAAKAFVLAKKMAAHMTEVLGCEGFNIVQNNGPLAGQTVFHFHIHLIPRYPDDQVGLTWKPGEVSAEELDQLVKQLRV